MLSEASRNCHRAFHRKEPDYCRDVRPIGNPPNRGRGEISMHAGFPLFEEGDSKSPEFGEKQVLEAPGSARYET
jgi:hypothetical protein